MRKYLAEFIAVFFLVFAGAGAIIADTHLSAFRIQQSFGMLGVALAHGLALALAIAAVGHISGGHVNPAISIAMWVARRLKFGDLIGYIVAQLLGAVAAAGLLRWITPRATFDFVGPGVPALEGVNVSQGTAFEIVLTFFLAFVIWGVAVDGRGPRALAPFAIGLVLTFDILAGGVFTGAAMNPARWFGPALVAGNFSNALVWTIGPILGALLASLLYETFLLREPSHELLKEGEVDEEEAGLLGEDLEEEDMAEMDSAVAMDRGDTSFERPAYTPPPPAPPSTPQSTMPPPPPPPMGDRDSNEGMEDPDRP